MIAPPVEFAHLGELAPSMLFQKLAVRALLVTRWIIAGGVGRQQRGAVLASIDSGGMSP